MNLALPAFILILFLLPGILAWLAYARGLRVRESVAVTPTTFPGLLVAGVLPSFVLHGVVAAGFRHGGCEIDLGAILALASGAEFDAVLAHAELKNIYGATVGYLLAVNGVGVALALLVRLLIIASALHRRISWLRFSTWYYLLSGEYPLLPEVDSGHKKPGRTMLVALVQSPGAPVLYKGEVAGFRLRADGSPDFVVLRYARRAPMVPEEDKAAFLDIPGECLVLRGEHIINYNFRYLKR